MELLPAQRDVRISTRRAQLDEQSFDAHDAVIVVANQELTPALVRRMPFGARLERHRERQARTRSTVSMLTTSVGPQATAYIVAAAKASSAFEQLSLGGRIWKALASDAPRRVLIATWDVPAPQQSAILQSMLAAVLAGSVQVPAIKSKRPPHGALESVVLYGDTASLDVPRALAVDRGNHVARWLTALPPNVLDSGTYRRALSRLSRRQRWGFTFLDVKALERQRAGAFLAVARANEHSNAGIARISRRARDRNNVRARIALVGKGNLFRHRRNQSEAA